MALQQVPLEEKQMKCLKCGCNNEYHRKNCYVCYEDLTESRQKALADHEAEAKEMEDQEAKEMEDKQ